MIRNYLAESISQWLLKEEALCGPPLCDFDRIRYEIRPCDVLLIEGRSRVSHVIKTITQSAWSHACLYIGRIHDVDDVALQEKILSAHPKCDPHEQLIVEGMLGLGTIVSPLSTYQQSHIRICRPRGLSRKDAQQVVGSCIQRVGSEYDVRQLFDLMRFFFPWRIMPRHWRSSLFNANAGHSTRAVCSTVIAEAFESVKFPILPIMAMNGENHIELVHQSTRLFTPRDFDYSPFFDIIKYPFIDLVSQGNYHQLPWNAEGLVTDGKNIIDPNIHPETITEFLSRFKKLPPKIKKESMPHPEDRSTK